MNGAGPLERKDELELVMCDAAQCGNGFPGGSAGSVSSLELREITFKFAFDGTDGGPIHRALPQKAKGTSDHMPECNERG